MAHRRMSIKKIRIDRRRRLYNLRVRSELKSVTRRVQALLAEKKTQELVEATKTFFSELDKAVKKGLLHENAAARRKSRLQLKINALKAS